MEHTISTIQSINGNTNHRSLTEEYNELCEMYTFIHKYNDVNMCGFCQCSNSEGEEYYEIHYENGDIKKYKYDELFKMFDQFINSRYYELHTNL